MLLRDSEEKELRGRGVGVDFGVDSGEGGGEHFQKVICERQSAHSLIKNDLKILTIASV